jgi:hypothetical protein
MRNAVTAVAVILGIVIVAACGQASGQSVGQNAIGEKLVHDLWDLLKTGDMVKIEKMMASGFQAVHQDGARDRKQEIRLLKKLKLGKYQLSKIRATRNGPVVVVSYFVEAEETIDGKQLKGKAEPRLSVFVKTDAGWQWIAHANLRSPK